MRYILALTGALLTLLQGRICTQAHRTGWPEHLECVTCLAVSMSSDVCTEDSSQPGLRTTSTAAGAPGTASAPSNSAFNPPPPPPRTSRLEGLAQVAVQARVNPTQLPGVDTAGSKKSGSKAKVAPGEDKVARLPPKTTKKPESVVLNCLVCPLTFCRLLCKREWVQTHKKGLESEWREYWKALSPSERQVRVRFFTICVVRARSHIVQKWDDTAAEMA